MLTIYGYSHLQQEKAKNLKDNNTIIRIIQPNIAQKIKWSQQDAHNNFNKLLTLSAKNLKSDKKYIFVWPETALPFNPEYDFSAHSQIIDLLNNNHKLITGKMRFVEKKHQVGVYDYYNSIFQISSNGVIKSVFDKVHLVPFGEYLPLRFILEKIGFSQINFFQSEFLAGKDFTPFALTDKVKAAGLICYEAIFPEYSKRIKKNNTDIIINVTNDAWFGNSFGPYQHLVQTQFRAVENQIPIIRSANTGISSFINKNGKIIKSLPLNKTGILDIAIDDIIN